MTKILRPFSLAALVVFLLPAAFAKDAPTSAEQLRSELEAAVKSKNTNAIAALFNWTGVAGDMKEMLIEMPAYLIKDDIAVVKLLPVPAGFEATNEVDGVRYFPNIPVIGIIDIESTRKGNSWKLPYGESAGNFYLSGTAQETFDAHAKKSNFLGVMVVGLPEETPAIFTCSYVFAGGGKETTGGFQCTNSWSENFRGDYIESCKLTKISGSGSFNLRISENAKTIFDSGMIKTNDSISYAKK